MAKDHVKAGPWHPCTFRLGVAAYPFFLTEYQLQFALIVYSFPLSSLSFLNIAQIWVLCCKIRSLACGPV